MKNNSERRKLRPEVLVITEECTEEQTWVELVSSNLALKMQMCNGW